MKKEIIIEVISGVQGPCLGMNNYRIAGPKPWGGGKVIKTFKASLDDIIEAIKPCLEAEGMQITTKS